MRAIYLATSAVMAPAGPQPRNQFVRRRAAPRAGIDVPREFVGGGVCVPTCETLDQTRLHRGASGTFSRSSGPSLKSRALLVACERHATRQMYMNLHPRLGAGCLMTALFALTASGQPRAQVRYRPSDIEAGMKLYQRQCVTCHGPSGNAI